MAIPDFQSLMLPLLKCVSDDKEHNTSECIDALAAQFQLTDEERNELLPSGRQARFDNRVAWTIVHLRKAGLLQSTRRGRFCITERGRSVLQTRPDALNMKFLKQYPEYLLFITGSHHSDIHDGREPESQETEEGETGQTPEEALESSYQNLRHSLALELLDKVKHASPRFFENMVVDLLVAMGYGGSRQDAGQAVGQSGDDGIDGIIKEDKLGLDAIYIQAKRWDSTVGRPLIQAFAGSLEVQRARKGVFITTSSFSQDARDYVSRIEKKIVLIDGEQLAQLMIDHEVGVAVVANYVVQRIDQDYFSED